MDPGRHSATPDTNRHSWPVTIVPCPLSTQGLTKLDTDPSWGRWLWV